MAAGSCSESGSDMRREARPAARGIGRFAIKVRNGVDDLALLGLRQLRIDRQRKRESGGVLRVREVTRTAAEPGETFLEVQGQWIIDLRLDPAFLQKLAKRIAVFDPNQELIVDVAREVTGQLDTVEQPG